MEKLILYPPIKHEKTINKFTVELERVQLFKFASILVILYDDDENQVDFKRFLLEGDDYAAWENDDKYIINYVKAKLQGKTTAVKVPKNTVEEVVL
jgi:hypothetical protein